MLYWLFPPEIKRTPHATEFAQGELDKMGRVSYQEKLYARRVYFGCADVATTNWLHKIDYAVVALVGICTLLLTRVVEWEDLMAERSAWDVFIWYGGMVRMAEALGENRAYQKFAEISASFTAGWKWWTALALLALIYFYAHYAFASITAHASAMFVPFLIVILQAGAPPYLAVLTLAYFSNLSASLTHYGTTTGADLFGTGYVKHKHGGSTAYSLRSRIF